MQPKLNNTSHKFIHSDTPDFGIWLSFWSDDKMFHIDEAEHLKAFFSVSVLTLVLTTEPVGPIIQDYKRS